MEQCIRSPYAAKTSEVKSRGNTAWTNRDMFGHSDLTWDVEREVKVMTWQLNFALRAIEEKEVNCLKWQLELLLNAIDVS